MAAVLDTPLARDATVREFLKPIQPFLDKKGDFAGVTDVAVNFPGSIFYENDKGWHEVSAPECDSAWLSRLGSAVARYSNQKFEREYPIMSAELPGGERLQLLIPPAVETGRPSLTVRVPDGSIRPMESYIEHNMFDRVVWSDPFAEKLPPSELKKFLRKDDEILIEHLRRRDFPGFLQAAVKFHKNIAFIGGTGSGKTTLMKTMCEYISEYERILTVEDVREIFRGSRFRNTVHMLYSKGGNGVADVTPAALLASVNRMKGDRCLLTELRGSEAFDMLKLLTSGSAKGLITSYHADNPQVAIERFCLMAGEHPEAQGYEKADLRRLVESTIDIILHVKADLLLNDDGLPTGKDRHATELYYNPLRKLELSHSAGALTAI